MNKIMKRINGLIRIAEKRERQESPIDKTIGRILVRNLKMVKKIVGEEIVCCMDCIEFADLNDTIISGHITDSQADELNGVCDGFCIKAKQQVCLNDYCSRGERLR